MQRRKKELPKTYTLLYIEVARDTDLAIEMMIKKNVFAWILVAGATILVSCGQNDKASDLVQKAQAVAGIANEDASESVNTDSLARLSLPEKLAAYQKHSTELLNLAKEVQEGNITVLIDYQKHIATLQELQSLLEEDAASFTPEQQKQFDEVATQITDILQTQE